MSFTGRTQWALNPRIGISSKDEQLLQAMATKINQQGWKRGHKSGYRIKFYYNM